jgi:hypothetical protein
MATADVNPNPPDVRTTSPEESSMASSSAPGSLSFEQLLEAIDRLSPAEQRELYRRLAARQPQNGIHGSDEAELVQATQARLSPEAERRLRKLIARSESGRLTSKELADYQALAQEAQRIDAVRAEALAELARRRGQPVQAIKAALDREVHTDET